MLRVYLRFFRQIIVKANLFISAPIGFRYIEEKMFGYLKIFVLKELVKSEMSGYELMDGFKRFRGSRPSPGTIYPMLSDLKDRGLITARASGKKKIYSITSKGKTLLMDLMAERKRALQKVIPLLGNVYSPDELAKIKEHMTLATAKSIGIPADFDIIAKLRTEVLKFAASKSYEKNHDAFRKILLDAAEKIRRLA
jgi:DNA-binding PadR family transcriptional regulator